MTRPVGHVDLAPTFCTIAGMAVPKWMEGKPLPVDDSDADARGFERVLTEWDSDLFGINVHLRTISRAGDGLPRKGRRDRGKVPGQRGQ